MQPLLSIVVPTKNRYRYLKSLILLIEDFKSDLIELVIQDNTSNNEEILNFLDSKFKFIKYHHTSEQIPVSRNSDLAILHSTGEYVCFIGDDDGVTRQIIDGVKWMKANNIEVLVPSEVAYFWPDFVNSMTGDLSGSLLYKPFKFGATYLNPKEKLNEIMEKGFINRGALPLVYHGIVRRDILNKIYEVGETFFPGASPDIANGVALSIVSKTYVKLDFPLIISGASSTHGGGIRKMKNKAADLDEIPFLPANTKLNWEKKIPMIWTGETIWADSAIKALRYMKMGDLVASVNFEYLLSWFACMNPTLWKMAVKLSSNKIYFFSMLFYMMSKRVFLAILRKVTLKLFNYNDGQLLVKGITDIREAESHFISKYPFFKA